MHRNTPPAAGRAVAFRIRLAFVRLGVLPLRVDGEPRETWTSFAIKTGQTLSFDYLKSGSRPVTTGRRRWRRFGRRSTGSSEGVERRTRWGLMSGDACGHADR